MTPGARQQAAIELLQQILDSPQRPADAVASDWLRARRFIGGTDRRAILNRVWGALRSRAQLGWWLARAGLAPPTPRLLVLADTILRDAWPAHAIEQAFDGGQHRPAVLAEPERSAVRLLSGQRLDHRDQPAAVRHNIPDWLEPELRQAFGERFDAELAALNEAAPTDLRANALRASRDEALAALAAEKISAEPTRLSPFGLRLGARAPVAGTAAFRDGLVEVQDEGSQLVALLAGAAPGMQVLDWCAGAGGKSLAMAACMQSKGRVVACDVSPGRLERAAVRLRRAGVHNVERRLLDAEGRRWAKRNAGKFDRVLIDAPCSGIGTWRRNPDARWKLSPEDVVKLEATQREILDAASRMVAPGGRLIWATCSLLAQENEAQVEAFLARHAEFTALEAGEVWRETLGHDMPADARLGPWLRLTPARHGTDGFFVAVLQRKQAEPKAKG